MSSKLQNAYLTDCTKRDFGILKKWTNSKLMSEEESSDNIQKLIAYQISKMIDNDYGKLMDLLYKTDISEPKVKSCFDADKTSSEIARDIAKLYLERMIQKYQTRLQFSNPDIVGDWD
jgi:hypothetical protein